MSDDEPRPSHTVTIKGERKIEYAVRDHCTNCGRPFWKWPRSKNVTRCAICLAQVRISDDRGNANARDEQDTTDNHNTL